jgi:hypothetical protein
MLFLPGFKTVPQKPYRQVQWEFHMIHQLQTEYYNYLYDYIFFLFLQLKSCFFYSTNYCIPIQEGNIQHDQNFTSSVVASFFDF